MKLTDYQSLLNMRYADSRCTSHISLRFTQIDQSEFFFSFIINEHIFPLCPSLSWLVPGLVPNLHGHDN